MIIKNFQLHNFRNISELSFNPSTEFNFIIGENGSGKSSLLEGIYLLSHGKAYRNHLNKKVIQYGQSQTTAFAHIVDLKSATAHQIGLTKFLNQENQIKMDGEKITKQSELAHHLPIQLITPETFAILMDGPQIRRRYIDWGGFHHFPNFTSIWIKTKQLLKQRNALLKAKENPNLLQYWNQQLIEATLKLTEFRAQYVNQLKFYLNKTLTLFFPDWSIEIEFYPGWNENYSYEEVLTKQLDHDLFTGYTSSGAHKADLRLKLDKVAVEDRFSRGQLKLLICTLKLAQGEFYSHFKKQPCIYLIDDLFSELDRKNQKLLFDYLRTLQAQVFITALETHLIEPFSHQNDKIFFIKSGIITN